MLRLAIKMKKSFRPFSFRIAARNCRRYLRRSRLPRLFLIFESLWFLRLMVILLSLFLVYMYIKDPPPIIIHVTEEIFKDEPVKEKKHLISTSTCSIVDENPFDPDVMKTRGRKSPYRCLKADKEHLIHDDGISFWADEVMAKRIGIKNCTYAPVDRSLSSIPFTGSEMPMGQRVYARASLIFVVCWKRTFSPGWWWKQGVWKESNLTFIVWLKYRDPQLAAVKREAIQERKRERNGSKPLTDPFSIHVIGLDGVSRLNSLRSLTRTRKVLLEDFNATEFLGQTKVSCCSLGNVYPMMVGKDYGNFKDAVWNDMKRHGFWTFGSEDWCTGPGAPASTFDFQSMDYDWYGAIKLKYTYLFSCHNGMQAGEALYSWLENVLDTHRYYDDPMFTFTFPTYWTHDDEGGAVRADTPTAELLLRLRDRGDLDRSVLFFISDHGPRFGPVTVTRVGRYEQRHPMLFIVFPDWFRLQFPDLVENAFANSRSRLTTPFDIHATLRHLLHLQTSAEPWRSDLSRVSDRAFSLLTPVPENRTCAQAKIPVAYCGCKTPTRLDPASKEAKDAAAALVDSVNSGLRAHQRLCHVFRLLKAHEVEKLEEPDGQTIWYWLVAFVYPEPARFGAMVKKYYGKYSMYEVTRLDRCGQCGRKCITGQTWSYVEKCMCK